MPELPEVQALASFLRERAVGHVVRRVDPASFAVLKTFDPPVSALAGGTVTGADRHGKFLDLSVLPADAVGTGPLHLIFHLSRAGWLRWKDAQPDAPPRPGRGPLALRLTLDDGSGFDLTEQGTQKRLAVYVVRTPADVPGVARLGPDPFDPLFTADAFGAILDAAGRSQLKGVLRDQSVIAGIGNAYSDEILHAARLSPFKAASALSPAERATLYAAMQDTLTEAVGRSTGLAAASLKAEKKTGLRVHARAGETCPVCGDTVREVSFADSALQYCPTCQTGGKPLADRRLSRLVR
jgi:formamidopyrimidine-DNA glycosylase